MDPDSSYWTFDKDRYELQAGTIAGIAGTAGTATWALRQSEVTLAKASKEAWTDLLKAGLSAQEKGPPCPFFCVARSPAEYAYHGRI